jgi:hypothetical protein
MLIGEGMALAQQLGLGIGQMLWGNKAARTTSL